MPQSLFLLMAQINPTVGAIEDNAEKIIHIIKTNQSNHDVIIFPELVLTGYPPEDLLFHSELFDRVERALELIENCTKNCYVIIGHPSLENGKRYNTASIIYKGACITRYHKQLLPNYGVFDECRYFTPGDAVACVFTIKGYRLGLCICEDIWDSNPVDQLIAAGIDLMVTINASPFDYNKYLFRDTLLSKHAKRGCAVVYVNQVGGQDELVCDGQSTALDCLGNVCARSPAFIENLQTIELNNKQIVGTVTPFLDKIPLIYEALLCGLRDYIEKNGFPGVLLGLSGGIDSALTLVLAVDALGASRVHAVMMPSRYTMNISNEAALLQLQQLNVAHTTLSIEPTFNTILATLDPIFHGLAKDTTEQNLQARIRGMLLMALSNKTGNMVLTTSNKSETAVGYATLYGDMCGGFGVLKDVLKTTIYELARYRNSISPVIPESVILRAPTAELAENQTDQDDLPEYDVLDEIITLYMEECKSASEIIKSGYPADIVVKVLGMIKRNEFKRRQSAPGVKISPRAFGRDWRYPITCKINLNR